MFARPAVRKVTFFRVLKKRDAPVNINRVCFVENLTAEPKLTTHRKAPPLLSSSFLHSSERQILGRPSVSFSIQIESISMSYFLSITGSQTKFSKSGFLLRTTGSILEQRAIELRAIHAVDLPVAEIANRDLTAQFIANTTDQVQQAAAILLLTPATKESQLCFQRCWNNFLIIRFSTSPSFCLRPVDCRRRSPS
jgi:hypothetical protein